ncbi:methyltransferase domain-containing protein [bacterium]|nr:methyltransferase domain-containing protein [bacterium]
MTLSFRTDLVALLRGYFACPVIAGLDDLGLVKRMLSGPFTAADLPVANRSAMHAALLYLQSLGLVEAGAGDAFQTTTAGKYVFERAGAFHLLRSYRDYFADFASLLSSSERSAAVRRLENIGGTGQLHARKYFPSALRKLAGRKIQCVVDVGCGDGEFLATVLQEHPSAKAIGVDLSTEAVEMTQQRLGDRVRGVVADGSSVLDWAGAIPNGGIGAVVSVWFVLHEFARGVAELVIKFLHEMHAAAPRAELIVGEIVALPADGLSTARGESVYPELLLFHALSGQGVLSWEQHREWIGCVPYKVASEERFDEVSMVNGSVPSSVVWHLIPIEQITRPD